MKTATVLLPGGGGVLCCCGRLYATTYEAARCDAPVHRPVWRRRLQRFLGAVLAVLMVGAIAGGIVAALTAEPSGYQVPDSGYPFRSEAP